MNQPQNPFEYGGAITDLNTAIERTEIDEVTTALYRGEYVSVLASRQSGKTTFLKQLQKRVAERHQTTAVYISFEKSAYEGGIKEVVKEFSQRVNAATNSSYGCSTAGMDLNLVDFLNSTTSKPLAFLVDELPSPKDTAFKLLCEVRAYYNENSNSRHLFVFAGSIDLAEFSQAKDSFVSPFNIARTIYLKDFQEEQIKTWVTKLVGDGFFSALVIQKVFEYTGGQPFLVQFLYSYLHSLSTNKAREAKLADIVTLIQDSQVQNTPNIKTMVDKVLDTKEWRDLLGRILENPQIPFTTSNKVVRNLNLNGCLKEGEGGYCAIRNPIYETILRQNVQIEQELQNEKRDQHFKDYIKKLTHFEGWLTVSMSSKEGNILPRGKNKVYQLGVNQEYTLRIIFSQEQPSSKKELTTELKVQGRKPKKAVKFTVEVESFYNFGIVSGQSESFHPGQPMLSYDFAIRTREETEEPIKVYINIYQGVSLVKIVPLLFRVR